MQSSWDDWAIERGARGRAVSGVGEGAWDGKLDWRSGALVTRSLGHACSGLEYVAKTHFLRLPLSDPFSWLTLTIL
jgi:hypothetical protein